MRIFLILLVTLAGTSAFSQCTETELIRTAFKLDKKDKVANFLALPDSVAKKFWPIYDKYELERVPLMDRRIRMLDNYVGRFNDLNNDLAERLWKESAAIQRQETLLREKYTNIIRAKVSRVVALSFYMIEDYIATAVKLGLYNTIPPPKQ